MIEDGVYKISPKLPENKIIEKTKIVYCIIGNQTELIDGFPILISGTQEKNALACAYSEKIGDDIKYFIRKNENGSLLNPESIQKPSFKSKIFKNQEKQKYLTVSKECFYYYLNFLKTKNITSYKFAERTRQ